jgi:muramoyltetrapeptide carboxypeptidase
MHTIQSWSINSSFSFYKVFIFFVLQSFNSQAQTPMTATRQFTKGDTIAILATARKILMTT